MRIFKSWLTCSGALYHLWLFSLITKCSSRTVFIKLKDRCTSIVSVVLLQISVEKEWKTNFIDHSLEYLTEVWELFSSHYLMPDSPPTALLNRIRRGSFEVTWLIPSGLIPPFIKQVEANAEFFQQLCILKVTVGKECIYEEITERNTFVSFL